VSRAAGAEGGAVSGDVALHDAWAGVPVLVTGGAGFIGSHLVSSLVAGGARVRVLDDLSTGRRENLAALADRCELMLGDIRDVGACHRACAGAAVVFHQAALGSVPRSMERPDEAIAINVAGTANVLTAARDAGARRVVYASSSAVYGDSTVLPQREGEEGRPQSPYGLSKLMGEELAASFGALFGLQTVGLRYFNVYGERQDPAGPYAAVIPRFVLALLAGEPVMVNGDGEQTRDFVHVSDVVAANLAAATAPAEACGRAYNVAAGRSVSLLELLEELESATGRRARREHGPPRAGDVARSVANAGAAERHLGFRAGTPLADGLRASLPWYERLLAAGGERRA
jgi:nucleoside-diphosphate-sugar epimerase